MSAKVDQFCSSLKDRLEKIEGRLESVKMSVQAFPAQAEKALRDKADAARGKIQAQRERMEKKWGALKDSTQQKMTETHEAINEWKAKREVRKLNGRAERAEAYAADALDLASFMIDEAEQAVLDAVVARMDADAVQSLAPVAR